MAARGPVPKPALQRRRTNKPKTPVKKATRKAPVKSKIPKANPDWHPVALSLYESLARSGQSETYEASDWSIAYLTCDSISRDLAPQVVGFTPSGEILRSTIPMKGASLSAYLKAFTSLLMTEGDRRRAGLELQRGPQADPDADRAAATVTDIGLRLASA
jgi:hypothetical protein